MEKVLLTLREWGYLVGYLIKRAFEEGLPLNAKILLEETAKIPVLRGLVTMASAMRVEWCLAVAIVIGILVPVCIFLAISMVEKKRRAQKIRLVVAAIGTSAILFADFIFWAAWLAR